MLTVIAKRIVRSWRRLFEPHLRSGDLVSAASRVPVSDAPVVQAERAKQAWIAQLQKRAPHLLQQWNLPLSYEPKAPRFPLSDLSATAPSHPRDEYQRQGVRVDVPGNDLPASYGEDNPMKSTASFAQSSRLTAEQSKNKNALPDSKSESMGSGIADTFMDPHVFLNQRSERLQSIFSQAYGDRKSTERAGVAHSRGNSNQRNVSPENPRSTQTFKSEKNNHRSLRTQSPEPRSDDVYPKAFQGNANAPTVLAEATDRWPALLPDRALETPSASGWMEAQHSQQSAREQRGL